MNKSFIAVIYLSLFLAPQSSCRVAPSAVSQSVSKSEGSALTFPIVFDYITHRDIKSFVKQEKIKKIPYAHIRQTYTSKGLSIFESQDSNQSTFCKLDVGIKGFHLLVWDNSENVSYYLCSEYEGKFIDLVNVGLFWKGNLNKNEGLISVIPDSTAVYTYKTNGYHKGMLPFEKYELKRDSSQFLYSDRNGYLSDMDSLNLLKQIDSAFFSISKNSIIEIDTTLLQNLKQFIPSNENYYGCIVRYHGTRLSVSNRTYNLRRFNLRDSSILEFSIIHKKDKNIEVLELQMKNGLSKKCVANLITEDGKTISFKEAQLVVGNTHVRVKNRDVNETFGVLF